jgi:hypothetical protein
LVQLARELRSSHGKFWLSALVVRCHNIPLRMHVPRLNFVPIYRARVKTGGTNCPAQPGLLRSRDTRRSHLVS